ncbi:MAG: hypothetical protein Q8Q10_01505 [bacterium]|nr:hypothetical protein [bacterium]
MNETGKIARELESLRSIGGNNGGSKSKEHSDIGTIILIIFSFPLTIIAAMLVMDAVIIALSYITCFLGGNCGL